MRLPGHAAPSAARVRLPRSLSECRLSGRVAGPRVVWSSHCRKGSARWRGTRLAGLRRSVVGVVPRRCRCRCRCCIAVRRRTSPRRPAPGHVVYSIDSSRLSHRPAVSSITTTAPLPVRPSHHAGTPSTVITAVFVRPSGSRSSVYVCPACGRFVLVWACVVSPSPCIPTRSFESRVSFFTVSFVLAVRELFVRSNDRPLMSYVTVESPTVMRALECVFCVKEAEKEH